MWYQFWIIQYTVDKLMDKIGHKGITHLLYEPFSDTSIQDWGSLQIGIIALCWLANASNWTFTSYESH